MKNITIPAIIILLIGIAAYVYYALYAEAPAQTPEPAQTETMQQPTPDTQQPAAAPVRTETTVIGKSAGDRDIVAYHYGTGPKEVLIVGGIHGGYEWNTSVAAYQAQAWLKANPSVIPANVSVTVIPVLNPDGLFAVAGTTGSDLSGSMITKDTTKQTAGRFNGNNVDLNRNFDCDWKPEGTWQNKKVSGGSAAFSEPESKAIQQFVTEHTPAAAVVLFSAAGGVYASNCEGPVSAATESLMNTYAQASKYPAHNSFNNYEITGDMVNWFAKQNIPAISVLLTNHTDSEWTKNQAGLTSVLQSLAQ